MGDGIAAEALRRHVSMVMGLRRDRRDKLEAFARVVVEFLEQEEHVIPEPLPTSVSRELEHRELEYLAHKSRKVQAVVAALRGEVGLAISYCIGHISIYDPEKREEATATLLTAATLVFGDRLRAGRVVWDYPER